MSSNYFRRFAQQETVPRTAQHCSNAEGGIGSSLLKIYIVCKKISSTAECSPGFQSAPTSRNGR
jgi:hypothetical protein